MTALTRVPQQGTLPGQPRNSAAANMSPVDKAAILMMLFGRGSRLRRS